VQKRKNQLSHDGHHFILCTPRFLGILKVKLEEVIEDVFAQEHDDRD